MGGALFALSSTQNVTIVFNDIPMFGDICKNCDGMQIVAMLNQMFGMFDVLSDKNKVYKVETVKDCFVGVAGAPERAKNHAELIMDMAMDMRDSVCFVKDPRPGTDTHIKIRLGSHSGQVVGGIVGNKCPRSALYLLNTLYCHPSMFQGIVCSETP